ncbi:hypothetical protein BD779DRAFT_1472142 [Infundibulicybe gibba]|nr:hypothetical protein BD779DRAFT_1472142 [Infundibulicybe gibba]
MHIEAIFIGARARAICEWEVYEGAQSSKVFNELPKRFVAGAHGGLLRHGGSEGVIYQLNNGTFVSGTSIKNFKAEKSVKRLNGSPFLGDNLKWMHWTKICLVAAMGIIEDQAGRPDGWSLLGLPPTPMITVYTIFFQVNQFTPCPAPATCTFPSNHKYDDNPDQTLHSI